eukprot:XP_027304655.1 gamma-2-syntrophin-like isoform X2 [Anas platyrhynchos]
MIISCHQRHQDYSWKTLHLLWSSSKTYMCSWQGDTLCFTVDFALGFTCFDSKTKNVLWRFKFSQLKGSSDDGKTKVKLLFQNLDTKQIETKENFRRVIKDKSATVLLSLDLLYAPERKCIPH